jgi:hypothetical protein
MNDTSISPLFPDVHPFQNTSGCAANVPQLINARAYELFEKRGRHECRQLEDWLKAEDEVKRHLGIQ